MMLAEELALVAIDPKSGRHALGERDGLNACLAGLLLAELLLAGDAAPGPKDKTLVPVPGRAPAGPTLRAVLAVVEEQGPKIKAILSGMSRGLDRRLGAGTWDTVVSGLVGAGVLGPAAGLRPRHELLSPEARDQVVLRLQEAAAGDGEICARPALVLSMTGPAQLLEVVAPERGAARRHARQRIDTALDTTVFGDIGDTVRKVLAEAAAIAASAATTGAVVGGG